MLLVLLMANQGYQQDRRRYISTFVNNTVQKILEQKNSFHSLENLKSYEKKWILITNWVIKAVPLQAWSGPEGSRKLRFPDFTTKAQDGGKVVSLIHRPPLLPRNTTGIYFC